MSDVGGCHVEVYNTAYKVVRHDYLSPAANMHILENLCMKFAIPYYCGGLILSILIGISSAEEPAQLSPQKTAPLQVKADEERPENQTQNTDTKKTNDAPPIKSAEDFLNEATRLKIGANTFDDMERVIQLCKKALAVGGLDEQGVLFANQMIVSTRLERAQRFCEEIFDRTPPSDNWLPLARVALADLELAVKRQDNLPQAHLLIGRIQTLPKGNRKKALVEFNKAIEQSAKNPVIQAMALALRGEITEEGKKKLADYNKALVLQPDLPIALRGRGIYYLVNNNAEKAAEDLSKLAGLEPEDSRVHEVLALSLLFQKKVDLALASLNRALELDPDRGLAHFYRAQIYLEKKDAEKAMEDINRAIDLETDNLRWRLLRAQIYHDRGDTKAALDEIERVLVVDPKLLDAVELQAAILAASDRMDDAITGLERAAATIPDNSRLLVTLAIFFATNDQVQQALDTYETLLTKPIPHGPIYRSRGDLLLNLGRQAEAIGEYEKALELDPEDSGILNNLAWVLATSPEPKLRDAKRSLTLANRACEATEFKKAHILSTLAAAHAENGDFKSAIHWSNKAVQIGDEGADEQLKAELEGYRAGKPWREIQGQDKDAGDAVENSPKNPVEELTKRPKE